MSAATLEKPKLFTADDLDRLSDQGFRYELIQGKLRQMSPSGGPHGSASSRVSFYVNAIVYSDDLGETFAAETGFFLEHDPDTILAPDFAFISNERLPDPIPEGFVPVVPDLAVETRSPSDTTREVAEKVEQWLIAGVRLVWVIEPKKRTITTHRLGRSARILSSDNLLDGEDVLPGLSVPVAKLFR